MSSSQQRQTALRAFAEEFNDATHLFKESDDEMAPKYALLPTGERANRVFIVGTVTETNDVGDDQEYWQARIVDPTGTFFVYAGQYQPEAAAFFRSVEPPEFVSVVGKPRAFETDEGNMNVTLRPEHVNVVGRDTKTKWVTETATRTLDRIEAFDEGEDADVIQATEQYESPASEYRQTVIDALESVTGDDGGD